MFRLYIIWLLVVGATLKVTAQDTAQLSLQQAVDYAKSNSFLIKNAQADVNLSHQKVNEIKSIGLPQVNASGNFTQYVTIPGSYVPNFFAQPGSPEFIFIQFQQKYAASGTVTASQLLWDGTYLMGLKAATEFVNLSKLLESKAEIDLETNVTKAYLMALTTKKNLELINQNLSTLEKSLSDIAALYKEGFAENLDVQRLEFAVMNLRVQRDKLITAIEVTLNLLKFQIGMPINQPVKLSDDLETLDQTLPFNLPTSEISAKNRIEYQLLNQSLALSYYDEKRYKLGYLPSLSAFISHQQSTNRPEFNFFQSNLTPNNNFIPATLWGLNLNVPIFDGMRKEAQRKSVVFERNKTLNNIKNFENAFQLEYLNASKTYENNLDQVMAQNNNLQLAQNIYEVTLAKYKEGVGSTLEITQAENDLKTAQINYLNAIYDLIISKVELKKSLGIQLFN